MKTKVENLILGAGITGLSTGYHLKKDYLILEKEDSIGGLARSKNVDGFTFDYSAHLLHCQTQYFYKWIQENLRADILCHKRNAWIYSHGVFTKYPFQANLYGLPKNVIKECLFGILSVKNFVPGEVMNFQDWCYRKFGSGICQHFMIPYNEKFWTLHPRQLTIEWIDGFIPQPEIRDILDGAFEYAKKEFGYHTKFFYPKSKGIELFIQKLSQKCKNIVLSQEVKSIDVKAKFVETSQNKRFYFKNLISTIPMPELKDMIINLDPQIKKEFSNLKFISVLNINLGIKRSGLSTKDWIYFPEENFIFYRVGFPVNFAPASTPKGLSSIYVDISYSDWKPINKELVFERTWLDLIKAGIIDTDDEIITKDINNIRYGYIIYDRNWSMSRKKILAYLKNNCIYPAGRFGAWHYLSMEGCFLEGKNIARFLGTRF